MCDSWRSVLICRIKLDGAVTCRSINDMVLWFLQINVVTETRLYTSWSEASKNDGDKITIQTGLIEGKKILNKLHQELANAGFNQVSPLCRCYSTVVNCLAILLCQGLMLSPVRVWSHDVNVCCHDVTCYGLLSLVRVCCHVVTSQGLLSGSVVMTSPLCHQAETIDAPKCSWWGECVLLQRHPVVLCQLELRDVRWR